MILSINEVNTIPQLLERTKKSIKAEENERMETKDWGKNSPRRKNLNKFGKKRRTEEGEPSYNSKSIPHMIIRCIRQLKDLSFHL